MKNIYASSNTDHVAGCVNKVRDDQVYEIVFKRMHIQLQTNQTLDRPVQHIN